MGSRGMFLWAAPAFVIGAVVGLGAGWLAGDRSGQIGLFKEFIFREARDVQRQVVILKRLRAKESENAIEILEARLDDQLVMFDPHEPYPGLTGRESAELRKAIAAAKEYRAAFPRTSKRAFVDEMV